MKPAALVTLAILGLAAPAAAQTGALVTAQLQLYAPGVPVTGTPTMVVDIPIASFVCGQVPPPLVVVGSVIVPHRIVIDDAPVAGSPRVCIADLTTFFATITAPVIGDYLTTITSTNDFGDSSPRSAASLPFRLLKPKPPAAWSGLRVVP